MKERAARGLAWSLWVLNIGLLGTALAIVALNGERFFDLLLAVLMPLIILGFATVGALIASRRSGNPIGWLYLVFAIAMGVTGLADAYVIRAVRTAPGSLPFADVAAWIQNVVLLPSFAVLPLAFLLFPDGRLLSRRWRPVLWAMVAFPTIGLAGVVIRPGAAGGTVQLPNPIGVASLRELASVLMTIGATGSVITALVCVAALVVRLRRARGDERQQVRWLAYVAAAAAVLLLATFSTDVLGLEGSVVGDVLFLSFFIVLVLGIPTASGIAILKYRLYDLDIVISKTVVYLVLAGFITLVYVVVVLVIPVMVFGAGTGGIELLPFLAVALVAVAFQPVRRWASRLANRMVYGKRATPYEVLSEFSKRVAGTYAAEDVLHRMAQTLGRGTGASRAEVWLHLGDSLRRVSVWPDDSEQAGDELPLPPEGLPALPGTDVVVPVEEQGETLGALAVTVARGEVFTPAERKLVGDLAAQAGLVLRNVRLIEELRASRQRIVAAQDDERRRLERNIHDGAQQQLVALSVKLRLAETLVDRDPERAKGILAEVKAESTDALENLRDLARGIYPPLLADKGLAAALEAQTRKLTVPVELATDGVGRLPQEVEAGIYFCVLEALQNVAKYSDASHVQVRLGRGDGSFTFSVADDGVGFDPATTPRGAGLQNMRDRVEALGGSFEIRSAPGEGTTVAGRVPVQARVA